MLVTASWGGLEVTVEVDAECRSVAALKQCLQEALPDLDVEAVRLEVGGRSVDDEGVLSLAEGSVIDVSASQAALATNALREEGCDVDFNGFRRVAEAVYGTPTADTTRCTEAMRLCRLHLEAGIVWPSRVDTPLHIAVRRDCRELCECILDSNCPKDPQNSYGITPLHVAAFRDNLQLTTLLLDMGCAKNVTDKDGITPLHVAVSRDNVTLTKLLIDSGCAKDARCVIGNTPLHIAVKEGNMQTAKLLIDSGCSKQVKNDDGNTPLLLCGGDTELYDFLRSRECE